MIRRYGHSIFVAAVVVLAAASPAGAALSYTPSVHFRVLVRTGKPLGSIAWTGTHFTYALEGSAELYTSSPAGEGFQLFGRVSRNGGEMRCVVSPGKNGWQASMLYCHASQGSIYRMPVNGGPASAIATIPSTRPSDGALAFDTVGKFGFALLAATGGSDSGPGGAVYAVSPDARMRKIGSYGGPGGAEQITVAPANFGSAAGDALISIDQHDHHGRLLAMDSRGLVRTLVTGLTWGLDPVVPLIKTGTAAEAAPGIYAIDWLSHDVLFAPAAELHSYLGDVLLSTERHAYMYVLRPAGSKYRLITLHTDLRARDYNLEGIAYIPA